MTVWQLLAPRLGCAGLLLLLSPAVMLVAWNMLESVLLRRRAFASQYLQPERWLFRWWWGAWLLASWQVLKAAVLVTALLVSALQWPGWLLLLLLLDVPVALGLHRLWSSLLSRQARPEVAAILARRLLVWSNLVLLATAVAAAGLLAEQPDYRGLGWSGTLEAALSPVRVGCELLAPLERLVAGKEALSLRLMQLGVTSLSDRHLALLAWVLYLLTSTLALLAWCRLLAGALIDGNGLRFLAGRRPSD